MCIRDRENIRRPAIAAPPVLEVAVARLMKDANTSSKTFRRVVLLCLFVFFLASAGAFPADEMTSTIVIGNSRIDVVVEQGSLQVSKEELLRWVQWAAESVSAYYGHFPIPHVLLRIIPADGKGVRNGRTFGEKGGFITIHVGSNTTSQDLGTDWMPVSYTHLDVYKRQDLPQSA